MSSDTSSPPCLSVPLEGQVTATASKPVYTARPRWSHDDDDSVRVVQNTHDYTQRIFKTKPQSARWVRGLTEDGEDDDQTVGFRRRRTNMNRWEELVDTADEVLQGTVCRETWRSDWLFYPNVLSIIYLGLIVVRVVEGLHSSYTLDYPTTLRQLERYGRRYGENGVSFLMRVCVPLAVPHAVGAAYTLILTYTIGEVSRQFIALCGVGLSLLSVGALFTQSSLLFACCGFSSSSHTWECDVPFALHHVCSVIRVLCPLLAVWCVSPVLDQLWGCGYRWRCVLALPCVMASVCLGISVYDEAPSHTMLDLTHLSVLLSWPLFVKSCWRQKRFSAVPMTEKMHEK
ncbi:hypothetical protein, conserved [Leishmania tarentolae]|uniref:Uncharacterized protein n=1 Tax=Leishmania tarentolae TaxID=5689 RepID=A0A640KKU9_LEITA|nr:hypothetical protein, conserved [Leishmania tarentolae]